VLAATTSFAFPARSQVVIGFSGIVLTGLVAAVSVRALEATARDSSNKTS
jgi:hypothetical protein